MPDPLVDLMRQSLDPKNRELGCLFVADEFYPLAALAMTEWLVKEGRFNFCFERLVEAGIHNFLFRGHWVVRECFRSEVRELLGPVWKSPLV